MIFSAASVCSRANISCVLLLCHVTGCESIFQCDDTVETSKNNNKLTRYLFWIILHLNDVIKNIYLLNMKYV